MNLPISPRERLYRRYFTVEEVNRLLPRLEAWLAEMRQLRAHLLAVQEKVQAVGAEAYLDAGGRLMTDYLAALNRYRALERRIEEEGILLRDVVSGLCDFPALRFDRLVYLSWMSGEPEVLYWHEVDTGLPGRRPLDESGSDDALVESEENKV
ncbi:MAG: hypothetical protein KatS3mg115_2328 [Candidatus Poribacteria bacterium]|nr:MAG: hypothetical protein KatS3mg115_2328 [Candidatus Poribacteria bacterium]